MDAFEILVVILSIALAIFLALGIAVLIMIIMILRQAKKIAKTVGYAADNIETFSYRMAKMATPMAIFKYVAGIFSRDNSSNKRRKV